MPAESSKAHAWQPGHCVGRYTVLGHLASGGMAEIFLARPTDDLTGRRLTVLKRINEGYAQDREFVTMFLDEARIAMHLSHPHVVRTFGLEKDGKSYYLAMEYLAGESLQDVITVGRNKGRPLSLPFAARLVAEAAGALHYAHQARSPEGEPLQIVHRDVSPHNLFVTYKGKLKVVDFGIAKATIKSSHTQTGFVKGKLGYLSPEQVLQTEIDGRTDVFALGIVLFEVLTQSTLFDDRYSDTEVVGAIGGKRPLPRPSERNPEVPPELDKIAAKAMSLNLDRRYPSAEAMQEALEAWLTDQGEDPLPEQIGLHVRALFRAEVERKDEMIGLGLRAASRPPAADPETTSTDLDLSSHPELQRRLQADAAPAETRPARPLVRAPPEGATEMIPPSVLVVPPRIRPQAVAIAAGLTLATFAATVALGGRLLPRHTAPGHLLLAGPPGAEFLLDGAAFDPAASVPAGHHHLIARLHGREESRELDLAPNETRQMAVVFPAEPE